MKKIVFGKTVKIKGVGSIPAGTTCDDDTHIVAVRVNNRHMCGTAYVNVLPYVKSGEASIVSA